MSESTARFKIENARVTRVNELEKVCFITVLATGSRGTSYLDVTLFQPAPFPLEEGLAVTITGDLSKRKPRAEGGEWTLELIGRKVEKGDTEKAPMPKQGIRPKTEKKPEPDDSELF
jgi:hypothetical protein